MMPMDSLSRFLRFSGMATLCVALAACAGGFSQEAKQKKVEQMLSEMKGPDVPGMEEALLNGAKQAEENNQPQSAAQFYQQLTVHDPKNEEYQFKYADNLRRAGGYEAALKEYAKLKDSKEYRTPAMEGAGLTLMAQGEFDEAGDELANVMEKDPTRWRTINAIGILFTIKQMYPEARQYFAEGLAQSPNNVAVLNNMGLMEALDGKHDEAIRILQDASRFSAKNKEQKMRSDLNLALVYAIKGDLQMAERTAAPHLTNTQLLNNMGYYAHLANDDRLARSYLNMALTASSKHYEKAWKNLETMNRLINSSPPPR